MKKLILAVILVAGLVIPAHSYANLFNIRIRHFVNYEAPEECAADVEIEGIDGGLINGTEALLFNGKEVGSLAGLPFKSGYMVGDHFLFASSSFALRFGLQLDADYDVEIDDQDCADLIDGDKISFRSSFGLNLGGPTLPTLRLEWSYSFNDDTDDYEELDLKSNSITLNSFSDSWVIGSGSLFGGTVGGSSSTGSAGCTLAQVDGPTNRVGLVLLMGSTLLALGLIRRKATKR